MMILYFRLILVNGLSVQCLHRAQGYTIPTVYSWIKSYHRGVFRHIISTLSTLYVSAKLGGKIKDLVHCPVISGCVCLGSQAAHRCESESVISFVQFNWSLSACKNTIYSTFLSETVHI